MEIQATPSLEFMPAIRNWRRSRLVKVRGLGRSQVRKSSDGLVALFLSPAGNGLGLRGPGLAAVWIMVEV